MRERKSIEIRKIERKTATSVYGWIKTLNKKVEGKKSEIKKEGFKEIILMYELYSYVERKNKNYLITFITRNPRQIVGYNIAFNKDEKRIQNIAEKALKSKYYSDANQSCQNNAIKCYNFKCFYFRATPHNSQKQMLK